MFYDIVLSFAGEDREYVEKIAHMLLNRGVKVFYDQFETSNLLGKDLYQFLNDVYKNKSKYCIIFVSLNYIKKNWTKHELKSAQTRDFESDEEYILPIYLENVDVPGLNKTVGYLDANQFSITEIVDIISDKLGVNSEKNFTYELLKELLSKTIKLFLVIGDYKEIILFNEFKDTFKTFLVHKVFYVNKEIYLACCSLLDDMEERLQIRINTNLPQEENVIVNFSYAIDLFSKYKKFITLIEYYINNKFDDEIDFFEVSKEIKLFEKDKEEDLIKISEELAELLLKYDEIGLLILEE